MKILHTEWSQGWGGQEIRIVAECKAMRAKGHEVVLACRKDAAIWIRAQEADIPVEDVGFRHTLDIGSIVRLQKILRQGYFDIIHTHSSIDSWCGGFAGRLAGVPVVRSRHLSSPVKARMNNRWLYNAIPSAVITSGETIRTHLIETLQGNPDHIFSVPAGADHTRFHPDVDGQGVRAAFNYTDEHFVIGIVAVLRSWKGHHVLIEAIEKLRTSHPHLRLLIAGDGPVKKSLKTLTAEKQLKDVITFAGHREDVPNVIKALDLIVLPSLKNEATSQCIPQAMLIGTPAIVSTAGGLPEIVSQEQTGLLVPPRDSDALAKAIARMAEDSKLRQHCAEHARPFALENLTFEKQINDTEAIYRFALEQK